MVPDEEAGEIASSIKELMSRYLTKHGSPSAFDSAASRIQADGQCSPDDTRVDCGTYIPHLILVLHIQFTIMFNCRLFWDQPTTM